MGFKFALSNKVAICVSGERGEVIGRAEYANAENGYFVGPEQFTLNDDGVTRRASSSGSRQ
ncbi:hypothetical protein [Burkholderia savannae]|uniref:hypothetical protein n=1 Tax=Burkholderia savannae TaxID=1637837 RepID=UPI0012E33FFD|nr:hypothetical protein [Burkholderia savannae]